MLKHLKFKTTQYWIMGDIDIKTCFPLSSWCWRWKNFFVFLKKFDSVLISSRKYETSRGENLVGTTSINSLIRSLAHSDWVIISLNLLWKLLAFARVFTRSMNTSPFINGSLICRHIFVFQLFSSMELKIWSYNSNLLFSSRATLFSVTRQLTNKC